MKLTIKTLSQSTFKIEIELDKTVKQLKEIIEKDHGKDFPCASQKLIYNGKILADENKLDEYNIDEKKFIVLMITRPPPAAKPVPAKESSSGTVKKKDASSVLPATTATPSPASKTKDDKTKSTNVASSTRGTASTTNTTSTTASTTAVSQNASSTTTSSANNSSEGSATASRTISSSAMNDILSMSEPQVASRLAALMTDPNFRQMQDVIQQTPQLLSSRIEELSTTNPELYRFISENPDAFVNMLNHPPAAIRGSRNLPSSVIDAVASDAEQGSGQPRDHRAPAASDQTFLMGVSEQDKEAIERLKELGFSEYLAIQAYIACEKDEQLAANLLFQMDQ